MNKISMIQLATLITGLLLWVVSMLTVGFTQSFIDPLTMFGMVIINAGTVYSDFAYKDISPITYAAGGCLLYFLVRLVLQLVL